MRRYPEYRESGVEWLGDVPSHWETVKLKHVARFFGGGTPDKSNLDYWKGEIPWVSPKDMKSSYVDDTEDHISDEAVAGSSTKMVDVDSVLVVVRSGILRHTIPVAVNRVPVALNQDMKAIVTHTELTPNYLRYFIQGNQQNLLLEWRKQGATVESIEQESLSETLLPLPSVDEQRVITDHLDRKTERIDTLIRKKQALIDLLREQRTALINRAMTKGLDPNVPTKDYGIEWLGDVPEHWTLTRLKFIAQVRGGVTKGRDLARMDTVSLPYMRVANVQDGYLDLSDVAEIEVTVSEVERYRIHVGDVLMTEGGDYDKLGRGAVWEGQIEKCLHQNHVFAVRPSHKVIPRWLNLTTLTRYAKDFFIQCSVQSTNLASISSSNLKELPVLLPPKEEQRKIIDYIDVRTSEIDEIIDRENGQIDLLSELRTSLVSEVVTGKIDVRGVVSEETRSEPKDVKPFEWWMLANHVIGSLRDHEHFGRLMLVKVLYVLQHHMNLQVSRKWKYKRWTLGPYSRGMIESVESKLKKQRYFDIIEEDRGRYTQVRYVPLENADDPKGYFERFWGSEEGTIDRIVDLFRELNSPGAEVIATLYAVWNDILIEGGDPTEDRIAKEFFGWDPSKEKYTQDDLRRGLQWMRDRDLIPQGYGDPVEKR